MLEGLQPCYGKSGNILDIAKAICSRSNRVQGFVSQHRVRLLMKGLCRTTSSCKAGLVVGALRIACNGLCTAARFHTAEENPGCLVVCHEGLDCSRYTIDAPHCSNPFVLSGLAPANVSHLRLSSMICCSKLPFAVTGSALLRLAYWMPLSRTTTHCRPTVEKASANWRTKGVRALQYQREGFETTARQCEAAHETKVK